MFLLDLYTMPVFHLTFVIVLKKFFRAFHALDLLGEYYIKIYIRKGLV